MLKKSSLKSIINLFLISGIAKLLSIIAKIIVAREISTYAMSVYSLTLPTLSLLLKMYVNY